MRIPISIILVTSLLPSLTIGSQTPPHLRHRRLANTVRHIDGNELDARFAHPARSNEAHAEAHRAIKRQVIKRGKSCQLRQVSSSPSPDPSATASAWSEPSSSDFAAAALATGHGTTSTSLASPWIQHSSPTHTTRAAWTQSSSTNSWSSSPTASSGSSSSAGGLLSITDSTCGASGANDDQPNGSEDWLNCGIKNGGWTPPMVKMDQLIAADLSSSGVFAPCANYIDRFNQYAGQYGVHPIMLASFAMQESTCNPGATGGNGEAGLMQVASENCGGAPGGNCYDVDFNIKRGAELFSGLISSNGKNVITAIGSYNGYYPGMTYSDATAEASKGDCSAQNNLDYIFQFVNGWMQNKSGENIGTYFNLKKC